MKPLTASLLSALLILPLCALAQNPPGAPVPPPGQQQALPVPAPIPQQQPQPAVRPPRPRGNPPASEPTSAEFEKNVVLHFEGSFFGTNPLDVSLLAGGSRTSTHLPLNVGTSVPAVASFEAVLTPGSPWKVVLSLGTQMPMETHGNIQFRDFTLNTTVLLEPGKKVVLWKQGEQKLTLTLEEEKE
jgi:hypothetical protein